MFLVKDTDDDDVALQRNREELTKELRRDKPRKEIVLSLSRQTFLGRRSSVLSPAEDVCVWSLLSEYSELKKPYVVRCPKRVMQQPSNDGAMYRRHIPK